MAGHEKLDIPVAEGRLLEASLYSPQADPTHAILIASAMGVKRRYYEHFARFCASRGCAAITFDYRGIGGSRPTSLRGLQVNLASWGRHDLAAGIRWVGERFPSMPRALVVHSVGGQLLGLAPNLGEISRVLAFGSQSGYWRHWAGLQRLRVVTLWFFFIPVLTRLFGYFPSRLVGLGDSTPAGVAREWAHWGRHPDYVLGRIPEIDRQRYRNWPGTLRVVAAGDDAIAPPPAVKAFLGFFSAAEREHRALQPAHLGLSSIGHFGYFRPEIGERLWSGELDWLLNGTRRAQ